MYDLFYHLAINMGKYLPQRERSAKITSAVKALVIFAVLSLFSAHIAPC